MEGRSENFTRDENFARILIVSDVLRFFYFEDLIV